MFGYSNFCGYIKFVDEQSLWVVEMWQGQLLKALSVTFSSNLYTLDNINLNRTFVIIAEFQKNYSSKKVCANGIRQVKCMRITMVYFF